MEPGQEARHLEVDPAPRIRARDVLKSGGLMNMPPNELHEVERRIEDSFLAKVDRLWHGKAHRVQGSLEIEVCAQVSNGSAMDQQRFSNGSARPSAERAGAGPTRANPGQLGPLPASNGQSTYQHTVLSFDGVRRRKNLPTGLFPQDAFLQGTRARA